MFKIFKGHTMHVNNYQFTKARKLAFGGTSSRVPTDVVRVAPRTLTLSPTLAGLFLSTRYKSQSGRFNYKVSVGYDHRAQALQLSPDAVNGFSFQSVSDDAESSISMTMSKDMLRLGMIQGDYVLVDRENCIFQLADRVVGGSL